MKKIIILSVILIVSSTAQAQEVTGSKLAISSSSTVPAGESLANINSSSPSGSSDGTVLNIQTGRGDTDEQKLISASNNVEEKFYIMADGTSYFTGDLRTGSELRSNSFRVSNNSKINTGESLAYFYSNNASGDSDGTLLNIQTERGNTNEQKLISASNNVEEKFYLQANGNMYLSNVAIGTTDFSGNHKLRVEGSIGAREIKVEASGWSDFVFDNDYELPTLEEVEQHINQNGHLPEIPSEKEITENGINLGEMNTKLLQKIEELTLYLIDQNKENQEQRKLIEELQKEVSALKNK